MIRQKSYRCSRVLMAMLAMIALTSGSAAQAGQADAADAMAERMLSAIGGRAGWAALKNTINGSQQNRTNEPTVVYAVITMDFEQPRFRIETTAPGLHLVRVVDGKASWRKRRNGNIEDVPKELFDDEMRWYASHLYRTIHRIAARDPALTLAVNEQGRLEVSADDERIKWFELDADGVPYRFGSFDDDVGTLCGPWDFVQDGIHHPTWVSNPTGTWRAAVRTLSVNVPLAEHMFARPEK